MKSVGEGQLLYAATNLGTNYYNIARDLSAINAKNEEITDREGHLYGYWVKVKFASSGTGLNTISLIPNTWKVRNSFRKFHFAREHMFREAGVTKAEMGKYGRTLRPYFNPDHVTAGSQAPLLVTGGDIAAATGGEWTYSQLASAPSFDDTTNVDGVDIPMTDSWSVHVLGRHTQQAQSSSGINTWTSVGMVQAYNEDRMEEIPDATADTSLVSPNNPLAALISQSVMSGEVTEIAADQELEAPPYDVTDVGDSINGCIGGYEWMSSSGTAAMRTVGTIFVPGGLLALNSTANQTNSMHLEVIGKELCKDVF